MSSLSPSLNTEHITDVMHIACCTDHTSPDIPDIIHLSFIRLRAHCSFHYENQSTREERSIGSQSVNHGNLDQIRPNNVILERTKIIIWSR